jgi:hypothetical protein
MSFIFNITVDATDYENPIINDANEYPVHNRVLVVDSATNSLVTDTLTLTGYTLITALKQAKALRLNGTNYTNAVYGVKDVYQDGLDTVIKFYDDLPENEANLAIEILQQTDQTNNKAVHRPDWCLLAYVTHKQSAGDVDMVIDNTTPNTVDSWTFETDDGGWFVVNIYAIPRFDDLEDNAAQIYNADDLIFEIVSEEIVFYKSLIDSNDQALSNDAAWEELAEDPTLAELAASIETDSDTKTEQYIANAFIDQKLKKLIDDINIKADCSCLDVCEFAASLKLSIYKEQIDSLILRKNFTEAQKTYEKAIQLAQDNA